MTDYRGKPIFDFKELMDFILNVRIRMWFYQYKWLRGLIKITEVEKYVYKKLRGLE